MSAKPSPRSAANLDKSALQSGIDKLARAVKELQQFDVSEIKERGESRLDHLKRKANNVLADIVGIGSAEYKKHSIRALDASLDMTFGDRYSIRSAHWTLRWT
jgi:hypothetical protein